MLSGWSVLVIQSKFLSLKPCGYSEHYQSKLDIMLSTLILFTLWKSMYLLMPTADVGVRGVQNYQKAVECSKTPVPNIPQVNRTIGNSRYRNCRFLKVGGATHKCINSATTVISLTSWNPCCTHCENIQNHVWNNVKLHKRNEKIKRMAQSLVFLEKADLG